MSMTADKRHFSEKLERILIPNTVELVRAMRKDPDLKKVLTTKIEDLQDTDTGLNYKYFSTAPLNWSLYEVVKFILDNSSVQSDFFYSKVGDKIVGFVEYVVGREDGKYIIEDMSVISFDLSKTNAVLARDTLSLVTKLRKEFASVSWAALAENPACNMYKRFCLKNGGTVEREVEDGFLLYRYTLPHIEEKSS